MKIFLALIAALTGLALTAGSALAASPCPQPNTTYLGVVQAVVPGEPIFGSANLKNITKTSPSHYEGDLSYFSIYVGGVENLKFNLTCTAAGTLHSNSTVPLSGLNAKVSQLSGVIQQSSKGSKQYTILLHGWAQTPSNPELLVMRFQMTNKTS